MRAAAWAVVAVAAALADAAPTSGADAAAPPAPANSSAAAASAGDDATAAARKEAQGDCKFASPPGQSYFWDTACRAGGLGCNADGVNAECRWCGSGDYAEIPCPPSLCGFKKEPPIPYFWDSSCITGMLGCWADGVNAQCRFCGAESYSDVSCPALVGGATAASCRFAEPPDHRYYWDVRCDADLLGCFADGVHQQCRFCGGTGAYAKVPCPAPTDRECTFVGKPDVPTYWEPRCAAEGLDGCNADGIHVQCRYCGAGAYVNVTCPTTTTPAPTKPPPATSATPRVAGRSPREPGGKGLLRAMDVPPAPKANASSNEVQLSSAHTGPSARLLQPMCIFVIFSTLRLSSA